MSESEIARNQFEFDKRRSDLQSALSRGEISEREYRLRIKALDEERARFELENNATIWQRIIEGGKSMLSAMADAYTSYFENLAQKYITDVVLNEQAERDKQAAAAETAAANSSSGEQSAAGAVKAGNANIFAAASQIAGKAIASLPFPVNIGASIAAAFLISKTLQGIRSILGFARGGLGIVGEAGTPEFIGPAKDFSQYSTNLALNSARETYRAVRDALRSSNRGTVSDQRVRIDGKVRASGREFEVLLQNELVSRRSELAVAG
jgi:hypothetical protein